MDPSIQRELNDKLYDKRKVGALNLERVVREALANEEHEKIRKIVYQLCHEYAYAVHQPHARNGGLIGLAAASIALGPDVARHLQEIVPPVLACFSDQDARVRYYACESMYNIAKVAKGEILVFFNDVFDALCKLAADSELSVKNGAELLDRLIKDIISESASTYVSVLQFPDEAVEDSAADDQDAAAKYPTAFSLARFIPLLTERINSMNACTRTFLVSWIMLLDSIPDLELVYYLPAFLGGLFRFLSDHNKDVQAATQTCLDRFLIEIQRIARVKRDLSERSRDHSREDLLLSITSDAPAVPATQENGEHGDEDDSTIAGSSTIDDDGSSESDWVPGQDVYVDHPKILGILVTFLDSSSGTEKKAAMPPHAGPSSRHSEDDIKVIALRWIESLFDICPEDMLPFVPRLLSQVLPALSSKVDQVRQAAHQVNSSLMEYIVLLSNSRQEEEATAVSRLGPAPVRDGPGRDDRDAPAHDRSAQASSSREAEAKKKAEPESSSPPENAAPASESKPDLDYAAAVNALTLQFLHENEATRIAALTWLIMLHRMAPRKILAINGETFPALLKTLSDPSEAVVTRDLQLLSEISKNSEDDYFTSFMVNLLQLFCTDRRLLETRGNLIIRQLCISLSAERIYRTLADCLEKDDDVDFASIMVQNLNNNLSTAPELADLRKRLRNLETRDGQTFFVALFRSWCHNAVATFSLCLLAQAYEQAYNLLQIFVELEMTIQMLIQIDKLVQLLESPVFTYLRLQLLEPEKYPHLYKCLYGLLMLLPQSSAFAALKNRLNSVSAIGYLHIAPRPTPPAPASAYERPNRLKGREEGGIRWAELLDKFKTVQERAKRQQRYQLGLKAGDGLPSLPMPGGRFTDRTVVDGGAIARDAPAPPEAKASRLGPLCGNSAVTGGGGGGTGNTNVISASANPALSSTLQQQQQGQLPRSSTPTGQQPSSSIVHASQPGSTTSLQQQQPQSSSSSSQQQGPSSQQQGSTSSQTHAAVGAVGASASTPPLQQQHRKRSSITYLSSKLGGGAVVPGRKPKQ